MDGEKVMNVVRKILSEPLAKREMYVRDNAAEFGNKYPVLTMTLCKRETFDVEYLKHMMDVLVGNTKECATEQIQGELQRKYLVPVIERLEKERNRTQHSDK